MLLGLMDKFNIWQFRFYANRKRRMNIIRLFPFSYLSFQYSMIMACKGTPSKNTSHALSDKNCM